MNTIQPFHVAFPVKDLKSAEDFYTNILIKTLNFLEILQI